MVHPDTALRFIDAGIGHGLVATRHIACGSLIWVRDALDHVIDPGALEALPAAGRAAALRYSARGPSGELLLFWDHARFINHSCAPASLVAGPHFSIAVRDIAAGEEITEDYALLNLLPEEAFACRCGARACRGTVGPGDVTAKAVDWARALRVALGRMGEVTQPLQPLLKEAYVAEARAHYGLG